MSSPITCGGYLDIRPEPIKVKGVVVLSLRFAEANIVGRRYIQWTYELASSFDRPRWDLIDMQSGEERDLAKQDAQFPHP